MDREQSVDPVDVLDTLVNQPATLSVEPAVFLYGDTWHAHNTPNLPLTPQIGHQRSQQSLGIDAVRFGSARSTINLQTCRIDDVVADVMCLEQTVEPEAVVAGQQETISTRFFVSLATRVRIRSQRSKSSFPSLGFNV